MTPSMKTNKFADSVKKGLKDIQLVAEEGNYKLFIKQFVFIIVIFLLYRWLSGAFAEKVFSVQTKMDSIRAQQANEQTYLASKQKLLTLEPRFPDMSAKNEWLARQVVSTFKDANLTPIISAQSEDAENPSYVVATISVDTNAAFDEFGKLMATIENKPEYLKVTSIAMAKGKGDKNDDLGKNKFTMRFNTIFPKEKVAQALFKDYKPAGGK